jgi:uncharacterized membrane protein
MAGPTLKELEARVSRLERLLNRVLTIIQERPPDAGDQPDGGVGGRPQGAPVPDPVPVGKAGEPEPGLPGRLRDEIRTGPQEGTRSAWGGGSGFLGDRGILAPGGTLLSRVGIGLLLLSVIYFFKYSIDQGWLTEWVRLVIGVGSGIALLVLGFKGANKGEPLGTVLSGGGIATLFITGFVGHQWFELVSYPVAFGGLVLASVLGIFLALRSGVQTLAIVGLIGALATPLLLTAPNPDVAGLALYVSLIVASVAGIYFARAWRALLNMAAVTAWLVLIPAVDQTAGSPGSSAWVLQGAIIFCGLVFWLAPLIRAVLRVRNPDRWPRPPGASVKWSTHLDALSLSMPLVVVVMSAWLWELSLMHLGWTFFGAAVAALLVRAWLLRSGDPEGSAGTQRTAAIVLATVGMGLVLEGDVLYLAFIAEAVVLLTVASRKEDQALLALGGAMGAIVSMWFLNRLGGGGTLLEGDLSSVFDLAAIGGAVFVGMRADKAWGEYGRPAFLFAAYLGLLGWTARELYPFEQGQALMSLAFGVEGTALLVAGLLTNRGILQKTGMATLLLVVLKVLLVDLAAVEPVWRVLLLFIFAVLFLGLSRVVQNRRGGGSPREGS